MNKLCAACFGLNLPAAPLITYMCHEVIQSLDEMIQKTILFKISLEMLKITFPNKLIRNSLTVHASELVSFKS